MKPFTFELNVWTVSNCRVSQLQQLDLGFCKENIKGDTEMVFNFRLEMTLEQIQELLLLEKFRKCSLISTSLQLRKSEDIDTVLIPLFKLTSSFDTRACTDYPRVGIIPFNRHNVEILLHYFPD